MRLKTIEDIQDAISYALQGDLEHGVRCLNEEAAKEFVTKYPSLNKVLGEINDIEVEE